MQQILVAGGTRDPNVLALIEASRARSVEIIPLLIGEDLSPSLTWELADNGLYIDGNRLAVMGTFMRRDVFHEGGPDADYRAATWYMALQGWLAASPHVRTLNRRYLGRYTNKLHVLHLAQDTGLVIPETIATNAIGHLAASGMAGEMIAKPIPGGGYCQPLGDLLEGTQQRNGIAASPAIVQQRISGPDIRIYRIGDVYMGFNIRTDAVDYRASDDYSIERMDALPETTVQKLEYLMDAMGLEWGAADFKIEPESNDLIFLEVNSDPMFSVFDRVAEGAITDAILRTLTSDGTSL